MKPYVQEALSVDMEPALGQSPREYGTEYHDRIVGIVLKYGQGDSFTAVWNETVAALPPACRMVFIYADWIGEIMGDGLALTLLNADKQRIRFFEEMVDLSHSVFLRERYDEILHLFTKKYSFQDGENFWSLHPDEETPRYFDEADMARIEEIGEEIDNWDAGDIDVAYRKLR